ncbi:MAG: hypothetical protein AB8F78_18850 [Saprospiraceae bacterium]
MLLALCLATPAISQVQLDLETGSVFTGRNDVRISGNQGTLFSLSNDLTSNSTFFYRLRLNFTIDARHTFSMLYAPLEVKSSGSIANDIVFNGPTFPANTKLDGTYKFNSYRLTYRYRLIERENLLFGLGLTAKIRDAKIGLASTDIESIKTNVGFVPIINFRLCWKMNETFGLLLDGDALAAPQGRAEDVNLALTYTVDEHLNFRAGYRILEGGADNDEVYNFSLFNYASVGVTYTLNPL